MATDAQPREGSTGGQVGADGGIMLDAPVSDGGDVPSADGAARDDLARPAIDGAPANDTRPLVDSAPAPTPDAAPPSDEICDGLDNDGDGVADDGLPDCDSCAPQHHELPLVTHWSEDVNGYRYLAADQIDLYEPYAHGEPYEAGRCYYAYRKRQLPDYGRYIGDTYSISKIADGAVISALRQVCRQTGVPIKLFRPDGFEARTRGLGRLRQRPGIVQVLHAKPIDGALATVLLPPNWSAEAASGSYPVVVNGFYDLNDNLVRQEGPALARVIALSGIEGRSGAIGVLWNGGGAIASRTMNRQAYRQFAAIIDWVAENFGGDRYRLLTFGGSRGGVTSMAMASNPHGYDYRVIFAAATVPPTSVGEHAQLQGPTFPQLMHAVGWTTGLADAWREGWTYPACAGRSHLTGLSGPEAHLYLLTGTRDFDRANRELSVMSPPFVEGLGAAATEVYLEVGTHDHIVPYIHQMEYVHVLQRAGVPVQADVLIRAGHATRTENGPIGATKAQINRLIEALLPQVSTAALHAVKPGISYYRVDRNAQRLERFVPPDGLHPFTVEFPYVAVVGERFSVVFFGSPATEYQLDFLDGSAASIASYRGTLPANGKAIVWVDVPPALTPGVYRAQLRIRKPGKAWQAIPATQTPTGAPATTTVVRQAPNGSAGEAAQFFAAPQLERFGGTNWGLSEY
jgi:acetyl esterase/lipase